MKLNIDWTQHPLGLVPDTTIAEAAGCTPAGVMGAREKRLIQRTTVGCGRSFPWWPGAWREWVDAWGAARVRAYVAARLPGLLETFDRDLPRIREPKPVRPRKQYPRAKKKAEAPPRLPPAPAKTVDEIAEARLRSLATARERLSAQRQARAAESVATAPVLAPVGGPEKKPLRIPESDARRFVPAHGDPESDAQRAAHRRLLEAAWARYVAEGGKVTVGAPAGSGSVTGAAIAVVAAPERFQEVSRVD